VVQRLDYQPFGGTLIGSQTEGNRNLVAGYAAVTGLTVKFTGKERDAETGLDYFGARYFSGAQGRFTSPDPKQFPHDITDPQSWNKYAYTRNNPLRYIDPDGEDWQDYLKGAINAFTSNNTVGVGRMSGGNGDFKTGQAIGDAVSTVTGAIETLAGTGGEVLGGALDLTGVGAAVGIPLNVASAGLIVHGGTTAVVSGVHLVQDANEATSSGDSNVGNNPREANGRTNTDLPGGHDAAKATFDQQTKGQKIVIDPKTGHQVAENGTRLRLNPDGSARVDIPKNANTQSTKPFISTIRINRRIEKQK
jgi:RHS repeat-associated protein